jgi:mgtE-like transporter
MIDTREVIKESVPTLIIAAAISVMSGLFLSNSQELLKFLPGILVIIPSFIGINGNLSSVITSRLSSALHLGLIRSNLRGGHILRRNINAMLLISMISFPILGFAAGTLNSTFGGEIMNPLIFPAITLGAGMITVIILIFMSIIFSYITYRKGLDPDNVVIPLLTTLGDLVGISVLLTVTGLVI